MANNYDVDYYKQLKDENYKTLLSSEIQLDNARQRALKQTNVGLASQGMASSGYGSTANTGIESQYISGLQNAQQNYQEQNLQIDQQAHQAQVADANDKFNSLTTLMSNATSNDDLNNIMKSYGYMNPDGTWNQAALESLDQDSRLQLQSIYGLYNSQNTTNTFNNAITGLSNGSFTSKEDLERYRDMSGYDKMTETQKQQFDYYYNKAMDNLSTEISPELLKQTTYNSKGYSTYDDIVKSSETMLGNNNGSSTDGRNDKIGGNNGVRDELEVLFNQFSPNSLQNGTVAQLVNGTSGNTIYLIFYNGAWYKTSSDQYNSSSHQIDIQGGRVIKG